MQDLGKEGARAGYFTYNSHVHVKIFSNFIKFTRFLQMDGGACTP
jgi:hypothetical protein